MFSLVFIFSAIIFTVTSGREYSFLNFESNNDGWLTNNIEELKPHLSGISAEDYSLNDDQVYLKQKNKDWDALIFTQNWLPSVCIDWVLKSKGKCNNFENGGNEEWTIHGLWPTKWGTHGPYFCSKSLKYSTANMQDIIGELRHHWPSAHGKESKFWQHEWEKHGTCAAQLPEFRTQHQYFEQILKLNARFNLKKILSSHNINPGNEYSVNKLYQSLKNSLNALPQIKCFNRLSKHYIEEIRICFDKKLSIIDCQGMSGGHSYNQNSVIKTHTDCGSGTVVYPSK